MDNDNNNNLSCGDPDLEAIGHTRTCLQPESGAGTMHSLQPSQLGNDSLLNMVLCPLLDMRGGASLCKPLKIPGGFWVAPVIGVSRVAITGRIWAESQKIPLVIGEIRTDNLALSNDVA